MALRNKRTPIATAIIRDHLRGMDTDEIAYKYQQEYIYVNIIIRSWIKYRQRIGVILENPGINASALARKFDLVAAHPEFLRDIGDLEKRGVIIRQPGPGRRQIWAAGDDLKATDRRFIESIKISPKYVDELDGDK